MAKCFAAEFCQFFEVPMQFSPKAGEGEGRGFKGEGRGGAVTVAELLQASLLVEVWHQVPKREATTTAGPTARVVGRRLGPSFHDVLLGVAHVPLGRLLSNTGTNNVAPFLTFSLFFHFRCAWLVSTPSPCHTPQPCCVRPHPCRARPHPLACGVPLCGGCGGVCWVQQ